MQRLRDLAAVLRAESLRARRSQRRHLAFERYYRRRELRLHRAELDQWAADCAKVERLPTQEVSR